VTFDVLVPDGFGDLVKLEKGAPVKLALETDPWKFGAYSFRFRQSARGLGVLSVEHPSFAMPYHLVVGSLSKARTEAPKIAATFDAGRVPDEGVFRREELLAKGGDGVLDIPVRRIVVRRQIAR